MRTVFAPSSRAFLRRRFRIGLSLSVVGVTLTALVYSTVFEWSTTALADPIPIPNAGDPEMFADAFVAAPAATLAGDAGPDAPSPTRPPPTSVQTDEAFRLYHCASEVVFCIDPQGMPLLNPELTKEYQLNHRPRYAEDVVPNPEHGAIVYVRVIGRPSDVSRQTLTLTAQGVPRPVTRDFPAIPATDVDTDEGDASTTAADTADAGDALDAADDSGRKPNSLVRLLELDFVMPAASAVVTFTSGPTGTKDVLVDASWTFPLHATDDFNFEGALFIPFTSLGTRSIVAIPRANTADQILDVHSDLHVTVGIALNYFPFSIRNAGAWTELPRYSTDELALSALEAFEHYVLSPLGFQAGTTLNFTAQSFREWYLGLTYEPIRGGAFCVGVAFLQGDFFAPGFSQGMLLPPGSNGQIPAGVVDRKYMVRPYIGLTISPEVITTLLGAFQSIKAIGHNAATNQ
jgi:hypothetical protein